MTVAATITVKQFLCNGATTQFGFPNKIFAATDLVVTLIDTLGNLYAFTNFANAATGLAYTVQGVDVDSGCTVVMSGAPTNGWTLDVRSLIPDLQSTSIKNQGAFLPELHEEGFDRATRELQDLLRLTYTFGIHGPDIEQTPWPALPLPSARKGLALMFDAVTGLPTTGVPSTQTLTQGLIGTLLYPQTPAELAAGVTPVNYAYAPGHAYRYATNTTPGTTDMTTALNNSLLQAYQTGGADPFWPSGTLLVSNLVITASVRIRTDGYATVIAQKSGLGDVQIINVQASDVYIEPLSFTGNIATDSNEFHHCIAIGVSGTTVSRVTVAGARGTNIRGDVLYIGADSTGPVFDVKAGQIYGTNILRNIVSFSGVEGAEVDSIAGSQIGYHLFDVEPNSNSQSPTGIHIHYARGGSVQCAGGALVGTGIGSVEVDFLDLDNNLQVNSSPGYFKFANQAGNIGIIRGDTSIFHLGSLRARNYQERLYNSSANTFSQSTLIDYADIANSDTTEAVFKTLFNIDAFDDLRINSGVIALTAVDRYIVKGAAGGQYGLNGLRVSGGAIAVQNTNGRFTNLTVNASSLASILFANCVGCVLENIIFTNVASSTLLLNSTGNTLDTVKESGSVFSVGEGAGCADNQVRHSTIAGIGYAYGRFSGQFTVVAMADANQTMTAVQSMQTNGYICTGALTAQRNLVLQASQNEYTVFNNTSGGFGIQVIATSGLGLVIANGKAAKVAWTGVNMQRVTPDT